MGAGCRSGCASRRHAARIIQPVVGSRAMATKQNTWLTSLPWTYPVDQPFGYAHALTRGPWSPWPPLEALLRCLVQRTRNQCLLNPLYRHLVGIGALRCSSHMFSVTPGRLSNSFRLAAARTHDHVPVYLRKNQNLEGRCEVGIVTHGADDSSEGSHFILALLCGQLRDGYVTPLCYPTQQL